MKKGNFVKVLRKESYWLNDVGTIVTIDSTEGVRHPVLVRFKKVNYSGNNTANFNMADLQEV